MNQAGSERADARGFVGWAGHRTGLTLLVGYVAYVAALIVVGGSPVDQIRVNGYRVFEISTPLGAVAVVAIARVLGGRGPTDFGLGRDGRWLADVGAGLAAGIALVAVTAGTFVAAGVGSIAFSAPPSRLLTQTVADLVYYAVGAAGEEVVYRGLFLPPLVVWARSRLPDAAAVAVALSITAFVFSVIHQPHNVVVFVQRIGHGLFYGLLFVASGRLWLAIGGHLGYNLALSVGEAGGTSAFGFLVFAEHGLWITAVADVLGLTVGAAVALGWVARSRDGDSFAGLAASRPAGRDD